MNPLAPHHSWFQKLRRTLAVSLGLGERNPALADAITALPGQGKRVFAAGGVLHMAGEQALPRLLAQHGWRVQRFPLAPM